MQTNNEWISIADMMSGLMMVFLFIAIAFMLQTKKEKEDGEQAKLAMRKIAFDYEQAKKALNKDLHAEFARDLKSWNAEILENNNIRFKAPDVLFDPGRFLLKDKFKNILNSFFPRYIKVLTQPKYQSEIDEVRIEGHTSSFYKKKKDPGLESYLFNAELSQNRSLAVLKYCFSLPEMSEQHSWLIEVLRANGLSFAKRIFDEDDKEDVQLSRRVEFRVITKTEEKIDTILKKSEG